MKSRILGAFTCVLCLGTLAAAASGPKTTWNVITLPNPHVTPDWRAYAPSDCNSTLDPNTPDDCALDHRFWEEWDFSNFGTAIDASMLAIASRGQYSGAMLLMPLDDVGDSTTVTTYAQNISLVYRAAKAHRLQLQVVVFPKWKYGAEWCYLYVSNAPGSCPSVTGSTMAVAYAEMIKLMNYVQGLGGACKTSPYNSSFAIWYGWTDFAPGYPVLKSFWESLPTAGCNLQASYIPWLDTPFSDNGDVQLLQKYILNQLHQKLWVNTELYSDAQIETYKDAYAPYQTVVTGIWAASDTTSWAVAMCTKWQEAASPKRLGVWTFYDRDVGYIEQYRSYINGEMAIVGGICH